MKKFVVSIVLGLLLLNGCSSTEDNASITETISDETEVDSSLQDPNEHVIELEGTCNTRDIGGYATKDGQVMNQNVFLRSDELSNLTEEDNKFLIDLGVDCVIDFRSDMEMEHSSPDALDESIEYMSIPIDTVTDGDNSIYDLLLHYIEKEENKVQLKKIFETISDPQYDTVLLHCTGGKDRTGMISIILLSIAGVDEKLIADDFAISEVLAAEFFDNLVQKIEELDADIKLPETIREAKPETALQIIDYMNETYGSVEEYLKSIDVSDETITNLKNKMLQK